MFNLFKKRALYGNSKEYINIKNLQTKSLEELKELANKRGIEISEDISKEEIIKALS